MGQSHSSRRSEPGASYRARAAAEARARTEASRRSREALQISDHRNAGAYFSAAQMHQKKMIEYNTLASNEIFRHYNPRYPSTTNSSHSSVSIFGALISLFAAASNDLSRLDLHGQHVAEAISMVKDHLKRCRREGVRRTLVITGRGAHSAGGVAKIKPEVEGLLAEMGVGYSSEGAGAFMVECGRERGGGIVEWVWRGMFGRRG